MIPVLCADEMRALEQWAIGSGRVASLELQERAAQGALRLVPEGVPVEVVAGPGNNGGDALALARLLKARGQGVRVWTSASEPAWKGDAAVQARRWAEAGGALHFTREPEKELRGAALIIDGLFGLGASRPLEGAAEAWAAFGEGREVLALDQPSGLRPDHPDDAGSRAVRSACFGFRKLCHALEPGRARCGEVRVVDLGLDLDASPVKPLHWLVDAPVLPQHAWNTHKGGRGHLAIRAGSLGMSGAAVLAALGALRAGAGLVTVLADAEVRAEIAAQIPEAMVRAWEGSIPDGIDALLAGPGGISEIPAWNGPLVLDASALIGGDGPRWMAREDTLITPHPGEFARLFHLPKQSSTAERLRQAREVAAGPGVCLLKGPQSLTVGGGSREVWINDTGHWGLATGGTGDFLAGIAAGLLVQGLAPRDAASSAAWLHGACADRLGRGPLLPRDLAQELPLLLRELYA